MKVSNEQLKRIIKEELGQVVESDPSQEPGWGSGRPYAGMSEEELIMKYNAPSSPPSVKMSVWIALEGKTNPETGEGYTEDEIDALLAKTSMKET